MNRWYELVAERAAHRCEYCLAPERVFNFPFEVEHILPRTQAGESELENLALACRSCNLFKSSYTSGITGDPPTEVRLFDPRQDDWAAHFVIDLLTGKINGSTAIGEATVNRLQLNRTAQLSARLQWIRWNVFP